MMSSGPCSDSSATPSFPSQLEWKMGLPRANPRGRLRHSALPAAVLSPDLPQEGESPATPQVPWLTPPYFSHWSSEWMLLASTGARLREVTVLQGTDVGSCTDVLFPPPSRDLALIAPQTLLDSALFKPQGPPLPAALTLESHRGQRAGSLPQPPHFHKPLH